MKQLHCVYLILGANLGDRNAFLDAARSAIASRIGEITKVSLVYCSEPWGISTGDPFLNQAVCVHTTLSPEDLLQCILAIESGLGRKRRKRWEPRTIDIDIAFYDDLILDEENLTIPHPHLTQRNFAMQPIVEIAPDLVHPVHQMQMNVLLAASEDDSEVTIFETR